MLSVGDAAASDYTYFYDSVHFKTPLYSLFYDIILNKKVKIIRSQNRNTPLQKRHFNFCESYDTIKQIKGGEDMIKTVIFDLDGLLVNSELMTYEFYKRILAEKKIEFSLKTYTDVYCGRTAVRNLTELIENYDLPFDVEKGMELTHEAEKEYLNTKGVPLKKGAKELLDFLKNKDYGIYLASSSGKERAHTILAGNGIGGYFDGGVFGDEIEHSKPAPDVFLKAKEKAGARAEECLVLEDSDAGIHAAYAAGIPVICIPDLKQPSEESRKMARLVLPSLLDVKEMLEKKEI